MQGPSGVERVLVASFEDDLERIDAHARQHSTTPAGFVVLTLGLKYLLDVLANGARSGWTPQTWATAAVLVVLGVALYFPVAWLSRLGLRSTRHVLGRYYLRRFAPERIAEHVPVLLAGHKPTAVAPSLSEQLARDLVESVLRPALPGVRAEHQRLRDRAAARDADPALAGFVGTMHRMVDRWLQPPFSPVELKSSAVRFADPVHGVIEVDAALMPLVMHPLLQRLAEIRQLAFAFPVYPSATHTRFSHSLGVAHLARIAMEQVLRSGEIYSASGIRAHGLTASQQADLVRLATVVALVHDVGHGPLGHALDRFFGTKYLDGLPSADKGFLPRILTTYLQPVIAAIPGVSLDAVLRILDGEEATGWENFVAQLIDSTIDVDRIDYLQRDAHFTGRREGLLNDESLLLAMRPLEDDDKIYLVFDPAHLNDVEQFVYARDAMYLRCYEHRAKVVSEWLALRAIRRLFETWPTLATHLDTFALLSDHQLIELVSLHGTGVERSQQSLQSLFRSGALQYEEAIAVPFASERFTGRLALLFAAFHEGADTLLPLVAELERLIAKHADVSEDDLVLACPLPNATDVRDTTIDILQRDVGTDGAPRFRSIEVLGENDDEGPSDLLRRLKLVRMTTIQSALDDATSLDDLRTRVFDTSSSVSMLSILRSARAKLRLFVTGSARERQAEVVQAFRNLGLVESGSAVPTTIPLVSKHVSG